MSPEKSHTLFREKKRKKERFSWNLAFCQGLAFDFCISALPQKRWMQTVLLRKTSRLRRKTRSARLSPPAVSRLRRSILALRARGLFLTDHSEPSLASQNLSPPAVSRLRRSILALRARGLFFTDHSKPSLWQRLHEICPLQNPEPGCTQGYAKALGQHWMVL